MNKITPFTGACRVMISVTGEQGPVRMTVRAQRETFYCEDQAFRPVDVYCLTSGMSSQAIMPADADYMAPGKGYADGVHSNQVIDAIRSVYGNTVRYFQPGHPYGLLPVNFLVCVERVL